MRILVITSTYPIDKISTDGNFVQDFIESIHSVAGDPFVVLAPHKIGAKFSEGTDGIQIIRFPYFFPYSLQDLAYEEGLPYKIQKGILPKIQVPFFVLSEFYHTVRLIHTKKIDLINSHWLIPQGLIGSMCYWLFNISHVVTIHSSEVTVIKKVPFGRKIAEFILKNSDHVVSASEHRLNELLDFVSPNVKKIIMDKSSVMSMGVDLTAFQGSSFETPERIQEWKSRFLVLFIGRLVEVKGCEYLVESIRILKQKIPNILLIIVGQGHLSDHLKSIVSQYGLEQHVEFLGFVDHEKIPSFLSQADVVVFPSIVDSAGFEEGLPTVLIEAMAAGKPIVATATKGFKEEITDGVNGLLAEEKNPTHMVKRLLELHDNQELCATVSRNARQSALKHGRNVVGQYYFDLFSEILNSHRDKL